MRESDMNNASKAVRLAVAAICLAGAVSAQANPRKYVYACEVQTQAGVAGLVMVQADTLKDAHKAALGASARTLDGKRSQAVSLVECIEHGKGSFRDSAMQRLYDSTPR
mgnify:CR=1 FL=1